MKYFIHAVGYGPGSIETEFNTEIERDQPIYSMQDIYEIQRMLVRHYQSRVLVRNWKRFESDAVAEPFQIECENPERDASLIRGSYRHIATSSEDFAARKSDELEG